MVVEKPSVTKDMPIGEVVARYPEAADVLLMHGLHCIGCHVSLYETIAQGAATHGLKEEQVDLMVREINEAIEAGSSDRKGVSLTSAAAEKLKSLMETEGKSGKGLRVSVAEGGLFEMDFGDPSTEDNVFEAGGLKVFYSKAYGDRLAGIEIDYKPESGFILRSKRSCCCDECR